MVMPGVKIPEGCTIGAKSFVYSKNNLQPWSVWIGNPLNLHKQRNKQKVLSLANSKEFMKQ